MASKNVAFNEKEHFIVSNEAHAYQAVLAMSVYKQKEDM